ncbi:hypothetical protein CSUI_002718 [Cystoisospora suis]|uniref:Transmembrane protein n=1 Tax=Cystoisospora suis TaxID=483139 RepID=A0A2C6L7S9_9APIC|nr:hypothetical protein CSUI_002718 [Cystoisospora suis]
MDFPPSFCFLSSFIAPVFLLSFLKPSQTPVATVLPTSSYHRSSSLPRFISLLFMLLFLIFLLHISPFSSSFSVSSFWISLDLFPCLFSILLDSEKRGFSPPLFLSLSLSLSLSLASFLSSLGRILYFHLPGFFLLTFMGILFPSSLPFSILSLLVLSPSFPFRLFCQEHLSCLLFFLLRRMQSFMGGVCFIWRLVFIP